MILLHFIESADDIPASSDDEEDDEDYDPENDEYWKKVSLSIIIITTAIIKFGRSFSTVDICH